MPLLENWNLALNVDDVLRSLGADPETVRSRRPALLELAGWALKEGLPLLEPVVAYREIPVKTLRHERLELNTIIPPLLRGARGDSLTGPLIAQHLGPAERILALVCTIGRVLEDLASEMMSTDPLEGWALDGLGSAAVETLATTACNHFEALAASQGLHTTLPLSPGMIGWPVEVGQPQIFALLNEELPKIGVSLSSSQQMLPRKTLSMVLGVGPEVGSGGRTCDFCAMSETCAYQDHYAAYET